MKVTTNNAAGAKDPSAGGTGTVDTNGKVTVVPGEKPDASDPSRPAWLPAEFKTPEEMAAKYAELSKPKQEEQAKATEQKVEQAKVDMEALEKEWKENNGTLTEETLEKLKLKGITEEMITEHVKLRQKGVSDFDAALADHVGGEENMQTLLNWAAQNLSEAQVARYNKALQNTKDPEAAKDVMTIILGKYEDANGKSGRSVTTTGAQVSTPGGVEPIADMKELVALQQDPKYRRGDKAFHAMVDKRLAASPHLYGGR